MACAIAEPLSIAHGPDGAIREAFLIACLLTGGSAQAECAVTRAIEAWDPEDDSRQDLIALTAACALRPDRERARSPQGPWLPLPARLRAVLALPAPLRQCFVLRMLAELSPDACNSLLDMSVEAVVENTCAALWRLACCTRPK